MSDPFKDIKEKYGISYAAGDIIIVNKKRAKVIGADGFYLRVFYIDDIVKIVRLVHGVWGVSFPIIEVEDEDSFLG